MRYTYSRWDGSQRLRGIDPDELMDALSDDLLAQGDITEALQRVVRWGMESDGEEQAQGLQHLLKELRARRQAELERYNLDSTLEDIRERVEEIARTEREGIERRLEEAADDKSLREMLEKIAERKRSFLDSMPEEPGSSVSALSDYEFLDDEAREKYRALEEMLERHVLERHFKSMERSLLGLTPEQIGEMKSMLHDLNGMLRDRAGGGDPDIQPFMHRYAEHFPGAGSLDDLVQQVQDQASHTEALMSSMSPEMRRTLDQMMRSVLADHALSEELAEMADVLRQLAPIRPPGRGYPFSGEETLSLDEALRLMRRMHDLDELERAIRRSQDSGTLEELDGEQVRRVMGDEAHRTVEHLRDLTSILEEAGYAQRSGDALELTARGIRRIGQKALQDIFRHLSRDAFGNHASTARGWGGEPSDDTKRYEFGDPFLLDLHGTLMNAVERGGAGNTLHLEVGDFEVFQTEHLTQSATVLMLDMSRSMPLRGCFAAAKKVTLALNSLIRLQYPRDALYIVGFSDYARELRPETLHQISWGDYVYGTNMQHGLMLARRLLGKHKSGTRQVILITDGEPTAHFEGGRVQFAYPPTFRTFQETLREVKRCTQEGIVINTFMLERSHYLTEFVNQMTKINHGRAFFATPERLGDYILVDFVANRSSGGVPRTIRST